MRRICFSAAPIAAIVSLACGDAPAEPVLRGEPHETHERSLTQLQCARDTILVGETMRLTAVNDQAIAVLGSELEWVTSDSAVVRVTYDGVALGYGDGVATVSATSGAGSASTQIRVREVPLVFTSIEAGCEHSCALTDAGEAFCWGRNDYGQLGHESIRVCRSDYAPDEVDCSPNPRAAAAGIKFRSLTAGCYHTCGVTLTGDAYCWGRNDDGQLGDGTSTSRWEPTPVYGDRKYSMLNADHIHTCGITDAGVLYCWGLARTGELAHAGGYTWTPRLAVSHLRFNQVDTEFGHTCAVTALGQTYCWGNNYSGVLGVADPETTCNSAVGPIPCTSEPQLVEDAPSFVQLSAGGATNCGRSAEGRVYCWGRNDRGQLGDGTPYGRAQPRQVLGDRSFVQVSVGHLHVCAVTGDNAVYCWGRNAGTFGNGLDVPFNYEPTPGAKDVRISKISAGFEHTCGLTPTGIAFCWGRNWQGQIGTGQHGLNNRALLPERVRLWR